IWLRAELPVHKKRTRFLLGINDPPLCFCYQDIFSGLRKGWQEPRPESCCCTSSNQLRSDEAGHVDRPNTGKGIRERSTESNGWICERRRCCEPVGTCNVGADRKRDGVRSCAAAAPDNGQKTESRDKFTEDLRSAGSCMLRDG